MKLPHLNPILTRNMSGTTYFIGAAIGAGLGFLASKNSDKQSAKNAAAANEFTKEQLQNRHTWEVRDLKRAGLNPMLSANAAPSIGSSAMAQATDKSSGASKGAQLGAQLDNIKADTELKKAGAQSARSQSALTDTQNTQQSRFSPLAQMAGDATTKIANKSKDAWQAVQPHVSSAAKKTSKAWDYINPKNLYSVPKSLYNRYKRK